MRGSRPFARTPSQWASRSSTASVFTLPRAGKLTLYSFRRSPRGHFSMVASAWISVLSGWKTALPPPFRSMVATFSARRSTWVSRAPSGRSGKDASASRCTGIRIRPEERRERKALASAASETRRSLPSASRRSRPSATVSLGRRPFTNRLSATSRIRMSGMLCVSTFPSIFNCFIRIMPRRVSCWFVYTM